MTDLYNDIRPYRDHEVSSVVDTLLSDNEFIDTLIALRGNRIAKWCRARAFICAADHEVTACRC